MKASEMRKLNKGEIEKFLEEKQALAVKLQFDIVSKQVKNHREYRNARKDVARALTILGKEKNK